jgi:hypothetical protein
MDWDVEPIYLDVHDERVSPLLRHRRDDADRTEEPPRPAWAMGDGNDYLILWHPRDVASGSSHPGMLIREADWAPWQLTLALWRRNESLSPLEAGLVLGDLLDRGVDRDELLVAMDDFLGLPRSGEWLRCYTGFRDLPESTRRALHEGEVDPRHVRFINQCPEPLQPLLHQLMGEGRLSLSVQETRRLMEATRRLDDEERQRITSELREKLEAKQDPDHPRQVGRAFLEDVTRQAYPRTTERRESFEETLEELDLEGSIHVQPPDNFEGDYIDFRIRCYRDDDLDDLGEALKECQPLLEYV